MCPLFIKPSDGPVWRNSCPYYYFKEDDLVWVDESKGTANNFVFVRVDHRRKPLFLQLYDHVTQYKPSLKNNLDSLVTAIETVLVEMDTHEMSQNASDFRNLIIEKFPDFDRRWGHGITKEELEEAMVITGWIEKRDVVGIHKPSKSAQ